MRDALERLTRWRSPKGAALLVGLAALVLYLPTLWFDFQLSWDDGGYVTANPFLQTLNTDSLKALVSRAFVGLWAPVQMLSYALDRWIWGFNPFGYHLTNVILHAVNAALVYLVVARLSERTGVAFFAAALFAVHPVNIEVVAWVSQRKTLLAVFFALSAILAYLRFRDRGGWGTYVLSLLCLGLGLMAKTAVVGLPLVLAAYEALLRQPGERRLRWVAAPMLVAAGFAAALIIGLWTPVAGRDVGTLSNIMTAEVLFGSVYPTMLPVFWQYLGLLAWPLDLSAYYDPPILSPKAPTVLVAAGAWLVVLALVIWKVRRRGWFWILWTGLFLAPNANIIPNPNFVMADRYLYLPAVGIFVLVGMTAEAVIQRFRANARVGDGVVAAAVFVCLVLAAVNLDRQQVWKTELALWQDTAAKSPNLYKVQFNLGVQLQKDRQWDAAEAAYMRALQIQRTRELMAQIMRLRRQRPQK